MDSSVELGARIVASGFGWHYPGRKKPSISQIDLTVSPGEKVLLLGPSGAGKSTLLHAIAGTAHDEDGESQLGTVTVDGRVPEQARGLAGLMQQDPESSVVLARVGDDVAFGPENLCVSPAEIWERVAQSLQAVGLGGLSLKHSTSALSGGQKQRLGLAGIFAMQPGALLLDEPTANLDPVGVVEVRDAVLAACELTGATLMVIEHRVAVWAEFMDRIIVIGREGGISHDGTPAQVLSEAREELISAGIWVPGYLPPIAACAGTAGETLIRAENLSLTRSYPARREIKRRARSLARAEPSVLDLPVVTTGISLEIRAGEHLSIVGPNGAGKSTLALTLAGLLYPASGILTATEALCTSGKHGSRSRPASADIVSWSSADLLARIGLVFQEPEQQFIRATVREELEFGPRQLARLRGASLSDAELDVRVEGLLERLQLTHVAAAHPFTLSGGEKRRLSVATALATAPRVLILDEPTFGQDANTWAELVGLIRELLEEEIAVVSVTHDLDFARSVGGRVYGVGGAFAGQILPVAQL